MKLYIVVYAPTGCKEALKQLYLSTPKTPHATTSTKVILFLFVGKCNEYIFIFYAHTQLYRRLAKKKLRIDCYFKTSCSSLLQPHFYFSCTSIYILFIIKVTFCYFELFCVWVFIYLQFTEAYNYFDSLLTAGRSIPLSKWISQLKTCCWLNYTLSMAETGLYGRWSIDGDQVACLQVYNFLYAITYVIGS